MVLRVSKLCDPIFLYFDPRQSNSSHHHDRLLFQSSLFISRHPNLSLPFLLKQWLKAVCVSIVLRVPFTRVLPRVQSARSPNYRLISPNRLIQGANLVWLLLSLIYLVGILSIIDFLPMSTLKLQVVQFMFLISCLVSPGPFDVYCVSGNSPPNSFLNSVHPIDGSIPSMFQKMFLLLLLMWLIE